MYKNLIISENPLDRVKLLMNYDLSTTKTENVMRIFEQKTPTNTKRSTDLRGRYSEIPTTRGSDYFSNMSSQIKQKVNLKTNNSLNKHVYKSDDGENFILNLLSGEFEEALLDLRTFVMTPEGMTTQTMIEVVLSPSIVVPVAIETINAAILLNDIDLYFRQGNEDPEAFYRVIEDILIYFTRGGFKLTGNALKRWLKTPAAINFMKNTSSKISTYVLSIKNSLNKLPKGKLKEFILKKTINLESSLNQILLKFTEKTISKIPTKYRKSIITGLLVYMSTYALDRLLNVKLGTTNTEITKLEGPSDDYISKLEEISKPKKSFEDIKTADDLNIIIKKGDYKKATEEIIKLYKVGYPCLQTFYSKNQFLLIASTEEKDIFKINNKEYFDSGNGIYETNSGVELVC